MALEFNEEFATEHKLTPEQVTAVTGHATTWHDNQVVELKGTYDGKANENAEAILNGAAGKITELTSIGRNEGEKVAEFMQRAFTGYSTTEKTALTTAKEAFEEKLKNFKGDEATATELNEIKIKFDDLQKKTANYESLVGIEEKYNTLSTDHISMKEQVVFGNEKPNFPDTANPFETKARWNEFMEGVKKEYDVELVEGESVAVSKENKHKIVKLKDLVASDEELTKLLAGRQQNGVNGTPVTKTTIEGIPFDVPQDMSSKDLHKFLEAEISKTIPNIASKAFSDKFGEYYNKIKEQQTA